MLRQELPNFLAAVNRRFVPHQNDRAPHAPQLLLQEVDDLVTRQVTLIRPRTQADGAFTGSDQQRGNCIESLSVLNAGPNLGRLPPWRPCPLERTNQRLPIFVEKYESCLQVMPFFLSWATYSASNGRSQPRHVEMIPVVAFDNSSPSAARGTMRRWSDTGYQIDVQSTAPHAPRSNSLRHNRRPRCRATKSAPIVSTVAGLSDRADAAVAASALGCPSVAIPTASVGHCGASRAQPVRLVPW